MASKAESFDYSNVRFVSDQEREYFAEAHLGEMVRDFLVSPVGRFLHGRAKSEIGKCKDRLAEIDPSTDDGLVEWKQIKQDMANAEMFMQWCAEAMINGDHAATQLQEID
jgi:hypothetical protein